jgi:SAM-dependent methyltransferase
MTRTSADAFARDVVPRLLAASAELLLDVLPPLQPQTRFLEVGAAGGLVARTLVERIAGLGRLVAVDVDPAHVAALPAAPRRAARAVASVPLPLADAAFDVALANLVLGGDDDARWWPELRRVLKPGGALLCTMFVRGSWDTLFDLVAEAGEVAGFDAVTDAVLRARDALPAEAALVDAARAHGLAPALPTGVEERLVGFAVDGAALRSDPIVRDVLLPSFLGGSDHDPRAVDDAIDDVVRAYFPGGVPVVARTAVLSLRAT